MRLTSLPGASFPIRQKQEPTQSLSSVSKALPLGKALTSDTISLNPKQPLFGTGRPHPRSRSHTPPGHRRVPTPDGYVRNNQYPDWIGAPSQEHEGEWNNFHYPKFVPNTTSGPSQTPIPQEAARHPTQNLNSRDVRDSRTEAIIEDLENISTAANLERRLKRLNDSPSAQEYAERHPRTYIDIIKTTADIATGVASTHQNATEDSCVRDAERYLNRQLREKRIAESNESDSE
jgi:hypothetical protein